MIHITEAAAAQIQKSAAQSATQGMCLRLAVTQGTSGAFEYGMGFDDRKDTDSVIGSAGVDVIVTNQSKDLFMGATLDYVEINPGEFRFIFSNPNDPSHVRGSPKQDA